MEIIKYDVAIKNGQDFYIAPVCDLQYTGPGGAFADGLFREYIEEAEERQARYIGLGDYVDFLSPSNRERLTHAKLYDTARDVIRDKAADLTNELYDKYLQETTGKWLGLVHGHHWADIHGGQTTDTWLAKRLKAPYLGTVAKVRINFYSDDTSNRHGCINLWFHHGRGNGRASAPINALEKIAAGHDADIYVMGHMTKLAAAAISKVSEVELPDGRIEQTHRTAYLVGGGGWSKAYMQGHQQDGRPHGCYVEEAALTPAALGGAFIKITPRWESRRWVPRIRVEI